VIALGEKILAELDDERTNDTLTRCCRTFLCRYTWKVPHDLATVTCPRCETCQPATRLSD